MLWSKVGQLDMTDSGNYALAQVLVQFNRAVLGAGVLLQVDDIGGIFGKCLGVVRLKPQLDAVLKLKGNFLCLPLGTLLRPGFRSFPSLEVAALAVTLIVAARNRDFESLAGLCANFLNTWHVFLSFRV